MKAKIYCEVTCNDCGGLALGSKYYKNPTTISKLKELTKDWIWDEERCVNVCPECQKKLNGGNENV